MLRGQAYLDKCQELGVEASINGGAFVAPNSWDALADLERQAKAVLPPAIEPMLRIRMLNTIRDYVEHPENYHDQHEFYDTTQVDEGSAEPLEFCVVLRRRELVTA